MAEVWRWGTRIGILTEALGIAWKRKVDWQCSRRFSWTKSHNLGPDWGFSSVLDSWQRNGAVTLHGYRAL